MKKAGEEAIVDMLRQFESWREGKNCKTGAPCALRVLIKMGLSPYQTSDLLDLFHPFGNCCYENHCDLPLEANLGIEDFIPEDTFDSGPSGR